tara:strand:+ start:200 stop:913 length:714 start_codon:yes stop_codon:yes gene_type:complete
MNSKNYISSRYYGNEATLFMNPIKDRESNKTNKKPNIYSSFIAVGAVFFFALFISTSVYAFEKEWIAYPEDDEDWIMIDGWNENRSLLGISISKEKCNKLDVSFYLSAIDKKILVGGERFIFNTTEIPHIGESRMNYDQEMTVSATLELDEPNNGRYVYTFQPEFYFKTSWWLEKLRDDGPFFIHINVQADKDDGTVLDPNLYLNQTSESWDMDGLYEVLRDEYSKCRLNNNEELII